MMTQRFSVVVFHRCMMDWRKGVNLSHTLNLKICPRYMCILLYVKCIWCNGFPEICAQLEEGVNLSHTLHLKICPRYTCILLYVKLIWHNSFPEIYAWLEEEGKLEGALLLGTRCHCMNTSSENMKSFWVCPVDVTCWGGKLKGDWQ